MTDLRRTPLRRLLLLSALMGGASLVEDTATGNPVTFETDVAKPLVSLEVPFTPIQEGSGDPSPQNIRSILPWNGLTVFGGGKNLLEISQSNVDRGANNIIYTEGKISVNSVGSGSSDYVLFKQKFPAGTYTMKGVPSGGVSSLRALSDKAITGWTFNAYYNAYYKDSVSNSLTFTATEEFSIGIVLTTGTSGVEGAISDIQLEARQTATAYEPFKPITETDIVFPSPVYGGKHEAVSGNLSSEWAEIASYNGETLPGEWLSDRDVYSAGTTPTIGAQVVYKLATPQEITLTPAQITALVGDNTIWSDADGSMTAVFLKKA